MTKQIIKIPDLALVMLIGPSGCGKSTFARQHFKTTEIISSDYCRALVADDENDQTANQAAFDVLCYIVAKRLARGKLVVVDATNLSPKARQPLVTLAKKHHVPLIAIVLNIPAALCQERNPIRSDRQIDQDEMLHHIELLPHSLEHLSQEGIKQVYLFNSAQEVENVAIQRTRSAHNLQHEKGKFDIIGDIHGCFDELYALLLQLGYHITKEASYTVCHSAGRRIIFVGDLVDRGPNTPEVLRIVMNMVAAGIAFCVNGNHDDKLKRKLQGREVTIANGLSESLAQLAHESDAFKSKVIQFLDSLVSHYVFDDSKLAVAHAGLKQNYLGRNSPRIRAFCWYGDTTGKMDASGLPVRYPWARDYQGDTLVVYGHTPVPEPEWVNNTVNIDTGCVFGGKLTALRYPEKETVSVQAAQVYSTPLQVSMLTS